MSARSLIRLDIRSRLLLLCLAVAAPLLLMSGIAIWKEYQTLRMEAHRATTFQAAIATRTLAHWISTQEAELQAIASVSNIKRLPRNGSKQILVTLSQAQEGWVSLILLDPVGNILGSNMDSVDTKSVEITKQSFFQKIISTRKPAISGYTQCPFTGGPCLLVGAPVIEGKTLKGILVASIEPHTVLRLFKGLGEQGGSVIAVVDENNRVLARTLNNDHWMGRDYSQAKTVQAAVHRIRGTLETVGIADPIARSYAYDRLPVNHWLVVVGVPVQAIYGPAQDRLLMMVMLTICALIISVVLAYTATGHFTRAISELVKEAVAIGRGDLTKRVKTGGADELGLLSRAFNQMAGKLQLNQEHKMMVEKISESVRRSLDLDQILNTTALELGEALSASRCCLALIDAQSPEGLSDDRLVFNHVFWSPERGGTPLKNRCVLITGDSLLKNIIEQGSLVSMDVLDDSPIVPVLEPAQLSALHPAVAGPPYPQDWKSVKSLMACPISTADRPLGVILIHQCDTLRTWTDAEQELVEAVARHVALAMDHARLYAQAKTLAEQELLINHIVRSVRSSLELDTILNTVTRELGEALNTDRCQIAQPGALGPLVVSHEFHKSDLKPMRGINVYGDQLKLPQGLHPGFKSVLGIDLSRISGPDAVTLWDAPIAVINDIYEDDRAAAFSDFLELEGTKSLIAAPLLDNDQLLGILIVHQTNNHRRWKPAEVSLVASIADQVAVAISHARLFAQVKHQSITDGMTGLYNHVYFKRRLTEELKRCQRKGVPCSLLMLDLDKLKQINDTFGHPVGDAAIRQVASTLSNMLRSGDTAARYGGEEFAVILPETAPVEAALIAERLCRQVNSTPVPGLGTISVSTGAATYPSDAAGADELIHKADQALYHAKHSGRNQVRVWSQDVCQADDLAEDAAQFYV